MKREQVEICKEFVEHWPLWISKHRMMDFASEMKNWFCSSSPSNNKLCDRVITPIFDEFFFLPDSHSTRNCKPIHDPRSMIYEFKIPEYNVWIITEIAIIMTFYCLCELPVFQCYWNESANFSSFFIQFVNEYGETKRPNNQFTL